MSKPAGPIEPAEDVVTPAMRLDGISTIDPGG